MTGMRIVRRTVIELVTCGDYTLTRESVSKLENMYKAAMGWQLPRLDVIIGFLKEYNYISKEELDSINKNKRGVC